MTRWVQQALLIMEKLFGHPDLHASDFRLTRLIDDIRLLPLLLVLPALLDMEQKKAHSYLSEKTERSYEDLLTALSVDISSTVLWIAFGENREINLQLVSSGLDQVAASLDLARIERLLLSPKELETMRRNIVRRVLERQRTSPESWDDWIRSEEVQRLLAQVKVDEAVASQVLKAWYEPVPLLYTLLQIDQHVSPFEREWTEEQVFQQLEASDDRTRFRAFYDLYRLAWQQPAWVFACTRADERLPVREIMLFALSRLGKDAPIEVALNAVLDKDPRIRAVAAYTLQALDVPAERLPLIGILRLLSDATPLQVSSPRLGVNSLSYRDGFFRTLEQLGGTRYILLQLLSKSKYHVSTMKLIAAKKGPDKRYYPSNNCSFNRRVHCRTLRRSRRRGTLTDSRCARRASSGSKNNPIPLF